MVSQICWYYLSDPKEKGRLQSGAAGHGDNNIYTGCVGKVIPNVPICAISNVQLELRDLFKNCPDIHFKLSYVQVLILCYFSYHMQNIHYDGGLVYFLDQDCENGNPWAIIMDQTQTFAYVISDVAEK